MKTMIVTSIAASLLALAGCVTQRPMSEDFGNATKQNFAVQIVNPETSDKSPTYDGAHTSAAVARYRQGQVTEPEPESTVDQQ